MTTGKIINNQYVIGNEVGWGAYGVVYNVTDITALDEGNNISETSPMVIKISTQLNVIDREIKHTL